MAEDGGISKTIWNGVVTIAGIVGATLYIIDHQDSNFDKKLAPLMTELTDVKHRVKVLEGGMIEFEQRSKINSACLNGAVSFLNTKYNKTLMKPYDLFDKPKDLEFEQE